MSPGMSERALNICAEFSNCFKSVSERIFHKLEAMIIYERIY